MEIHINLPNLLNGILPCRRQLQCSPIAGLDLPGEMRPEEWAYIYGTHHSPGKLWLFQGTGGISADFMSWPRNCKEWDRASPPIEPMNIYPRVNKHRCGISTICRLFSWGFTLGFPHLSVRLSWGNISSHLLPSLCPPALQEALQVLQSMTHFGLLGDVPWRGTILGKKPTKKRQLFDDFDGFSRIFGHDGWWQRSLWLLMTAADAVNDRNQNSWTSISSGIFSHFLRCKISR